MELKRILSIIFLLIVAISCQKPKYSKSSNNYMGWKVYGSILPIDTVKRTQGIIINKIYLQKDTAIIRLLSDSAVSDFLHGRNVILGRSYQIPINKLYSTTGFSW